MKLYQHIISAVIARQNCEESGNTEQFHTWDSALDKYENFLPSGSGFDSGTRIDRELSEPDKLVLHTSFHHMNEVGYYEGWTEHDVIIRPSLLHDIKIRISGRNRNDIKEYMYEVFECDLTEEFPEDKHKALMEDL